MKQKVVLDAIRESCKASQAPHRYLLNAPFASTDSGQIVGPASSSPTNMCAPTGWYLYSRSGLECGPMSVSIPRANVPMPTPSITSPTLEANSGLRRRSLGTTVACRCRSHHMMSKLSRRWRNLASIVQVKSRRVFRLVSNWGQPWWTRCRVCHLHQVSCFYAA